MVTFTRPDAEVAALYVAASDRGADGGWLGYILPGADPALKSFGLAEALTAHAGSLLFASVPPDLSQDPAGLARQLEKLTAGKRRCLWLAQPGNVQATTVIGFELDQGGAKLKTGAQIALGPEPTKPTNLSLEIASGDEISAGDEQLELSAGPGSSSPLSWQGSARLRGGEIGSTTIACAGPQRGCLQFRQSIELNSLHSGLSCGFQTVLTDTKGESPSGYRTGWYPLAEEGIGTVPFAISVDPTDAFNATAPDRTSFSFRPPSRERQPTVLVSGYRTSSGQPVTLAPVTEPAKGQQPARLWLHGSPADTSVTRDFVASPVGDFKLGVEPTAGTTAPPSLLCGLAGTETIAFSPEDTMRFKPRQPAFAAGFPYPPASPTLAPVQPLAPRLEGPFLTSWASLVPAQGEGNHYSAQPKGASLYAKPSAGHDAGVLLFAEPGTTLKPGTPFPLLPYALVGKASGYSLSPAEYGEAETKVVAVERRARISQANLGHAAAPPEAAVLAASDGEDSTTMPATTPAGFVVQVEQASGRYAEVGLAQDARHNPPVTMKLVEPPMAMQQALQTSQLFAVLANTQGLGSLVGWQQPPPSGSAFHNAMTIEDWVLRANVGQGQQYGDYGNVLIVKGRRGKLSELVAKPDLWTQAGLAIPSGKEEDAAELAALSRWLQDYVADAKRQDSEYFQNFNKIVEDESWTGVLVLKADIAAVPGELTGMLGGIEPQRFKAHHFGFTITRIDPAKVAMQGNSATFGLIYYVDPAVDPSQTPPQPVAPKEEPFDFRVLTLKVLFENAAVVRFESNAQLSLRQLFGQAVDHMGGSGKNPFDALMLTGALHRADGVTSYSLEVEGDSLFFFKAGVFNKIELLQAQFSTTSAVPEGDGTKVSARFDLRGFLDFKALEQEGGSGFDLLSFGSESGGSEDSASFQGLSFSGLGVTMSFTERPDGSRSTPAYAFDASAIAFDLVRSTTRPHSLVPSLGLKVDGLVGGAGNGPGDLGYLDVATPLRLPGVSGEWYGLRLRADFGTPGALAGKVGLTSYLLLAWSPAAAAEGDDLGTLGLLLPGGGAGGSLLHLQGVMELAVGPVGLTRVTAAGGGSAFMLVLNEIALKFLGVLKLPPSGATAFYLFGDTTGNGGPLGWLALYDGPKPAGANPAPAAELEA